MKKEFIKNLKNLILYTVIPYIIWSLSSDFFWNIIEGPDWSTADVREYIIEALIGALGFLLIDILIAYAKTKKDEKNGRRDEVVISNKRRDKVAIFGGIILVSVVLFLWNGGINRIISTSANCNLYMQIELEQPQKVQKAIDEGANVNKVPFWMRVLDEDINQYTPLTYAVTYTEDTEIIKLLIKEGADINAKDKHGYTTCETAVIELHKEQVNYFYIGK